MMLHHYETTCRRSQPCSSGNVMRLRSGYRWPRSGDVLTVIPAIIQLLSVLAALAIFVVAQGTLQRAAAQSPETEIQGTSYIKPFPKDDIYRLTVIGDDLGEALQAGLAQHLQRDARVRIAPRHLSLNGLMRPNHAQQLAQIEQELKRDPPDITVVMLGAWDRVSLRDQAGKRIPVGSPEWRNVYGSRADRLLKMLKGLKSAVYLVGLPNVRKFDANDDVQMMNETLRERVYLNSLKFIDSYAGFLDENGRFNAWGPDLEGKIVRLRDNDGVYFTTAGRLKLAHFVEREVRRDIKLAQAERVVSLAGSEEEQARINPGKAIMKGWDAETENGKSSNAGAANAAAPAGPADQPADHGKINLTTLNADGREDVVTVEIVRPAIPASVVALVTRKERPDKPSQLGEVIVDRIAGGLNVMSTITPPVNARGGNARGVVSPTQTPYYRALVRGERLPPRPGRIDDLSWPRADAIANSPAQPSQDGDTELETGSSPDSDPAPPATVPSQSGNERSRL